MSMKRITERAGKWRGALITVATPGMLLMFAAGCKTKAQDAALDAAAVSTADADAGFEVAPPPAVVSGDPDIPLNEAVVGTTPVPADYAGESAPPAPVVEDRPAIPDSGDVWVPGYWWWSTPFHRYVWVSGAWRNPPPDQVWTPGEWVSASADRYLWMPGFWGTPGVPRPAAIELAPPPPRVEAYGEPPSVGFIWTPGFYAYRGNSYYWTDGLWLRPPSVGLGWIEPRYVGIGGRYYFQAGRWDFGPEHRGTCYLPDINVRAGMHFTPTGAPPELVLAHARFVTASSRAVAFGGTRMPNGGYAVRGGVNVNVHVGPGNEPHAGGLPGNEPHAGGPPGNEPHAGGPPGNEPHAGGPPGNEPHAGGLPRTEPHAGAPPANEPHGGSTPHGGYESHPGGAPHGGPAMGGTEPHGGAPAHGVTVHGGAHGGAPPAAGGEPHGMTGAHNEHPLPQGNGKKKP
jgi:hypothetical protein